MNRISRLILAYLFFSYASVMRAQPQPRPLIPQASVFPKDDGTTKLANFIRDSPSQFLRFAAGHDRFTDASQGLMSVAVAFVCGDAFSVFLECDTR